MLLRERRLRRVASRMHLWAGLILGPLVLVLGLSGTVLVFRAELEDAVNGPPAIEGRAAPVRSLDAILMTALVSHPHGEPRALRLPTRPDRPYRVELASGPRRLDIAVDPYTLRVVGARAPERSMLAAVHSLHAALHAGRPGTAIVGVIGLGLLVESVTGLWLYGPAVKRRVRDHRTRRASRVLHRLVGGLSLVVGVIVGITGALLALASALAVTDHAAPRPDPTGAALARLDIAAARADAALPGGRITALVADAGRTIRVEKRLPWNGAGERIGRVRVDRDGRTIVAVETDSPRARAWDVVRRLHAGDFAGRASSIVYAVAGLALSVLAVTGGLISARRA